MEFYYYFNGRFGRKTVLLVCGLMNMAFNLGSTYAPNPMAYYVTRFLHSCFNTGAVTANFVIGQ